jgi:hypothetical protein
VALADLRLEHAWIVYPGTKRYPVHSQVTVLPLADVAGRAAVVERTDPITVILNWRPDDE